MGVDKLVILRVCDGWQGCYINGHLLESSDNSSQFNLIRLMEQHGLIEPGIVSFVEAKHELDADISLSGQFPGRLPDAKNYRQ